jgi:hypothetical protein
MVKDRGKQLQNAEKLKFTPKNAGGYSSIHNEAVCATSY